MADSTFTVDQSMVSLFMQGEGTHNKKRTARGDTHYKKPKIRM